MPTRDEVRIREAAYLLWERDGRPQGKAAQYWLRAETQLSGRGGLPGWSPEHAGWPGGYGAPGGRKRG